jgi:hypothetical protein
MQAARRAQTGKKQHTNGQHTSDPRHGSILSFHVHFVRNPVLPAAWLGLPEALSALLETWWALPERSCRALHPRMVPQRLAGLSPSIPAMAGLCSFPAPS